MNAFPTQVHNLVTCFITLTSRNLLASKVITPLVFVSVQLKLTKFQN